MYVYTPDIDSILDDRPGLEGKRVGNIRTGDILLFLDEEFVEIEKEGFYSRTYWFMLNLTTMTKGYIQKSNVLARVKKI